MRKLLLIQFWVPVAVCLAIIVPYENDWLIAGSLQSDKVLEYYVAIAMELITICLIPLSLRLFKFKIIRKSLMDNPMSGLKRWGSIRLAMLTVPMMVNAWLYYQFMNVAFGYMGIIGLLSLVFIYPSKTRCDAETTFDNTPEDKKQ